MHCCNWAVLSSITCLFVSPYQTPKAFSEADFPEAPLCPWRRSYIVPSDVTKSPYSLSTAQTHEKATDTRFRIPALPSGETFLRLKNHEPLLSHLADRVGRALLRVA